MPFQDLAHPVDMPADQVPAQGRRQGQGLLQVDVTARTQPPQGGQGQGLAGDIRREVAPRQIDGGKTDPIDGHAVPQDQARQGQLAGAQGQADIAAPGFEGLDLADGLNDAGKHSSVSSLLKHGAMR